MSALRRSIANANNDVINTQYYTQKLNEYEWPPDVSLEISQAFFE